MRFFSLKGGKPLEVRPQGPEIKSVCEVLPGPVVTAIEPDPWSRQVQATL